ncbi:unnamed protein product, partial [Didymodactylos carnosus]
KKLDSVLRRGLRFGDILEDKLDDKGDKGDIRDPLQIFYRIIYKEAKNKIVLDFSITRALRIYIFVGQKPRTDVEFWRVVKENNILDEDDWPGNVEEIYETPAEKAPFDLLDLGDELDTPGVNDANEKDTSISAGPVNVDTTASLAMLLTSSVTDLDDGTTLVNLISFDSPKSLSRPIQDLSVVDVAIPDTDMKTTQTYDLLNELIVCVPLNTVPVRKPMSSVLPNAIQREMIVKIRSS